MTGYVAAAILVSYGSLLVELVVLRVPSVASSLSIWSPTDSLCAGFSPPYRRLLELSPPLKALLIALPLLVVYAVYTYPLLVVALTPDPLNDYLFRPVPVIDTVGVVGMIAGRALSISTALALRPRDVSDSEPAFLNTSGPFRWSRNPGLVGMYLFVAGIWLTMPSASLLVGIAIYIAYMDFKIRMEEDFLANRFGQRYADYRLRAGRYLRL